jgi:hypothetical protein
MILVLFLLVACAGHASKPGDHIVEPAKDVASGERSIKDVAAEFRHLRTIKGHFEGGTWNDDVDGWMGRKHRLMVQLGARLGTGEHSRVEVIRLLAPPDQIAHEGNGLFALVSSLPEFEKPAADPYEFLIYFWRGKHDFLYFTSQGETVINSGWWYAGE